MQRETINNIYNTHSSGQRNILQSCASPVPLFPWLYDDNYKMVLQSLLRCFFRSRGRIIFGGFSRKQNGSMNLKTFFFFNYTQLPFWFLWVCFAGVGDSCGFIVFPFIWIKWQWSSKINVQFCAVVHYFSCGALVSYACAGVTTLVQKSTCIVSQTLTGEEERDIGNVVWRASDIGEKIHEIEILPEGRRFK